MRWGLLPLALAGAVGAAIAVPTFSGASSHREAPAILEDPTADNTDVYFFRSPEKPNTATIIANWIPFEEPHGGPNFYRFSTNARYNLNVDRNGDGDWDLRYQYRFKTRDKGSDATGYVNVFPAGQQVVSQVYDLHKITKSSRGREISRRIGRNVPVSPNNTGPKSLPNYLELRQRSIRSLRGGYTTFAGQADDPFFVDLGMVFDLVNLDAPGRPNIGTGNTGNGVDSLARYNTHSIALQVPISTLRGGTDPKVGVYASTERPVVKTEIKRVPRRINGRRALVPTVKRTKEWVQVSRLGNPLINEVVVPHKRKDAWNAADPSGDAKYSKFYRQPFVGAALNQLFPQLNLNIPTAGRTDIEAALLNGLDLTSLGLADNSTGTTKADLLRLNLSTPVNPGPMAMGALQGDPQGFPNGRRLGDDVVDIELRVIGGALFDLVGGNANKLPLGDGVNQNDVAFENTFPYVAPAHDGFSTQPSHYRTEPPATPVGALP
ncbi:MAG: DUF4331 domain-containing protein [Miltoncostaeaceae bacterium]